MSSCTFVIIKDNKARYVAAHYSFIKELLQGTENPEHLREMSLYVNGESGLTPDEYTDTGFNPAVVINFDKKVLGNTPFNWFDDFEKYLKQGWMYIELVKV